MGYKSVIAATVGTIGAFALGYWKGNAAADGHPLPAGIDALITYGTPIAGGLVGADIGARDGMEGANSFAAAGIMSGIGGLFGAAAGGVVGLVAQGAGYLTGSVLGKYI